VLALIDLYQLLRAPRPIDALLQAILDTAIAYVPGAQRGSLLVLDSGSLRYRATYGYDLEQLRAVSFPASLVREYIVGSGTSAQVLDFSEWDEANLSPETNRILREHGHTAQIRRSLMTPILVSGRFYGNLVLDNLRDHAPFPASAETLARLLAVQAGALLEQALLMEQIRQASTMLVESEKLASLGRFIASIAHEINNPLTAVIGYADLLADAGLNDESREMLGQVRAGAERVRIIVRSLQIFARQQHSGQMAVSLSLLAEQALTLKRGDYALDEIEVRANLPADLPMIWADGGQLSQVLLNLLVNAQYALRQRLPPRLLTVRAWAEGPRLLLSVADNGPGIAPEALERIFEPFYTTRPAGQGTGLGLSICEGIIGAHGGAITVRSTPGAGAEFIVDLPAPPLPPAAPGPALARRAQAPAGLAILSVDDDPVVRAVLRRTLGGANALTIAERGEEALRLIAAQPFDLVLCDLKMPGMGGDALYRRAAVERPAVAGRFLFISGDTSSATAQTFLAEVGRPLLAKPFTAAELFDAIAGIIESAP
jgi:two-component system NtrC family sensor kinase